MTVPCGSLFHSVIVLGKKENLKIFLSFRYNKFKIMASPTPPFSVCHCAQFVYVCYFLLSYDDKEKEFLRYGNQFSRG